MAIFLILILSFSGNSAWAKTVGRLQAINAVDRWLKTNLKPFKMAIRKQTRQIQTFPDANGLPIYYVVYLQPGGFVIISADNRIEPIIAFADDGTFDPSIDNPLGALVTQDLSQRMMAVQSQSDSRTAKAKAAKLKKIKQAAKDKWSWLTSTTETNDGEPILGGQASVSDVRIEPLVQSKWDQDEVEEPGVCQLDCYNYYTPNNYYCGCVATAMAQVMKFHEYPAEGVDSNEVFIIKVDGVNQPASLIGSDGFGGPYDWAQMMLVPDCSITTDQRKAIGAICYDAGVSVQMQYSASSSGAYMSYVDNAMVDTFSYSNAIQGNRTDWSDIGDGLLEMINPNLDAGLPVVLGIEKQGATTGHAIVCDGYGYNYLTLYHHLNMGWSGTDDAWYNLPIIQGNYANYDSVTCCIYNIFTAGTGEIISGRVTDSSGNPISQATITAIGPGSPGSVITDANGIYAFTNLASASTYSISVSKSGYNFQSQNATTGTSTDNEYISGNKWEIDFTGTSTIPADFTGDLIVDMDDFAVLAGYWHNTDCNDSNNCGGADFEPDGDVDSNDLKVFTSYWLENGQTGIIELNDVFYSIGSEDGRVWDDGGGCGINNNSYDSTDAWALRLGDWQQYGYRDILSFDLASLPADAQIISAQVELTCGYSDGVSPFTGWGGNCYVDIANPSFGSAALENSDWEAAADANAVADFTTDPCIGQTIISSAFNAEGLSNISTNGKTQLRVYFQNSNSGDGDEDFVGFYSGDNADPNKKPKLKINYTTTATPTVEFHSIAAEDGRVWAQWNASKGWYGTGFDDDAADQWALRLGDYLGSHSLRVILSFNTSALPDDCTILSARLQMTRSDIAGTDPFVWGGNCYIDINSPYFGTSENLENIDWQVDANSTAIAEFLGDPGDENPMVSTEFNAAGLDNINKSGKTQFRIYFTVPTYGPGTDSLYFYSGETANEDKKPKLIIQYLINQ